MKLSLQGVESGHECGGLLHFPTREQWDLKYPEWRGRRERVKSNIIDYAKTYSSLSFLAEFLLDENRINTVACFVDDEKEKTKPLSSDEIVAFQNYTDDVLLASQEVVHARQAISLSRLIHQWLQIGLIISAVALIFYMVVR